jgi:SAM-dependent methyltransferase
MQALSTLRAPAAASASSVGPDLAAIKQRQQATWASGDYAVVGSTLQIVGERLAEAVDIRAGEQVIDVAAGNGNVSLSAARRFADVVATDYVPVLLEKAARRAQAEGLQLQCQVADAEALPFGDGRFDVALSTFGVMFSPDHTRAAQELLRVTRPGGRIGLANWTPDGFVGRMFQTVGALLPPPPGLRSPALWGRASHLQELFGARAARIDIRQRQFLFRYRSTEHWLQVFRDHYGPTHKAFAALDAGGQVLLEARLRALLREFDRGGAHSLVLPSDYLEVVIHVAA